MIKTPQVSLLECSSNIIFFFQGSIDVDEMMKIVGKLYEMDGLAQVCNSSKCLSKYVLSAATG